MGFLAGSNVGSTSLYNTEESTDGADSFGRIGFQAAAESSVDNTIIRIPILRDLGNLGEIIATVAAGPVFTSNPALVIGQEGVHFDILNKTVRWGKVSLGGLFDIAISGENGFKFIEIQLKGVVTQTTVFTIEIVQAQIKATTLFPFVVNNDLIRLSRNLITLTIEPGIKQEGQVGFLVATGQPVVSAELRTVDLLVDRFVGSFGAVTVDFATADGTAIAGADYVAQSGTLSWADGDNTPKTITLTLLDVAGTVDFTVALSNPTNGLAIDPLNGVATVEIYDIPAAAGDLAMAVPQLVTQESVLLTVTVRRLNGATGAVSVAFRTVDGSAEAGTHFTNTTGTLNWAGGDSADKTFDVPILTVDTSLAFRVEIHTPGGGAALLVGFEFASVTIQDAGLENIAPILQALENPENYVRVITLEKEAAYIQQITLARIGTRLVNGVIGFDGALESFGGGVDLPPQPEFVGLEEADKYGISSI